MKLVLNKFTITTLC